MSSVSPKRRKELKDQLRLWLDMGWPRWQINKACIEQLDIETEFVDELILEIRHEQQLALTIDRADFLAQQMTRLEALATKAQEGGNLAVALAAFKELHVLAGLHTASR
jgi:hypothetical protein